MKIILASASPRRNQIMTDLGIPFTKITASAEEINHAGEGEDPSAIAVLNASAKAGAVVKCLQGNEKALVIGADTIVEADGRILPKPENREHAERMLESLSGRTHRVITGLAVIEYPEGYLRTDYQVTEVTFRPLSPGDIQLYLDSGEPLDKAGAYGIQGLGAFLVERVNGDYPNVVGLPLMKLYRMLKPLGADLFKEAVKAGSGTELHVI